MGNQRAAGDAAVFIIPGELIGTQKVCELLDVDKATVFRRIRAGELPVLAQLDGPGGAYVFNLPDILAYRARTSGD